MCEQRVKREKKNMCNEKHDLENIIIIMRCEMWVRSYERIRTTIKTFFNGKKNRTLYAP